MKIVRFVWPEERIDHIARHGVEPEEVEEACFGRALVQRAKSEGENPVYYIHSESDQLGPILVLCRDSVSRRNWLSRDCTADDRQRKASLPTMEESMSSNRLPKTDSIEQLAQFWDTHDLTEFEENLEEVAEPVFERESKFTVHLDPAKADAIRQIAESHGCPPAQLIQLWVDERISGMSADQRH